MEALNYVITWDRDHPTTFEHTQIFGRISEVKNFGGGLEVPVGGVACMIKGAARSFYCYQSLPGLIPMYYLLEGSKIHVSQSLFAMRSKAKEIGAKIKDIIQCKEGVAYHWSSKGLARYVVDKWEYTLRSSLTLEKAADQLLDLLVAAAGPFKGQKVLTLVSGGTDGILTAYALKLAGIEQHCVCIGRTEDDFDPKYAKRYCEELGLPYEFMTLPSSDEGLQELLTRALSAIEMADFSNVLMGMCNVLAADKAKERGCSWVANADLADVILGNDILTQGSFKKKRENPLPKHWADERLEGQLRTLPTNLQIFKAFMFNGVPVFQLFGDRQVIQHMLGLSFTCTPLDHTKPLYYAILNKVLTDPSWGDTGKKVGYYSGSGIGKIRLENPVLMDENIRKTFHTVCP